MENLMSKLTVAMVCVGTLFLASCSEIDPLPLAQSSFNVATSSPERNLPVKFENLSTNAAKYLWNFGDSSETSTEIAPIHTYEESGEFIVSLTAITNDDQVHTESKLITIGERYLTGMYIININMKDGNEKPWDSDGTGPDVLMQFGPVDFESEDEIEGFFVNSLNVGNFQTPIGISTDDVLSENYKLTDEDFFIILEEVDTVKGEPVLQKMIELIFNPRIVNGESITEIKREDGTGDLTIPFIVLDEYQFFLEFEVR